MQIRDVFREKNSSRRDSWTEEVEDSEAEKELWTREGGGLIKERRVRREGSRILEDYRARHQRITASQDKIYM